MSSYWWWGMPDWQPWKCYLPPPWEQQSAPGPPASPAAGQPREVQLCPACCSWQTCFRGHAGSWACRSAPQTSHRALAHRFSSMGRQSMRKEVVHALSHPCHTCNACRSHGSGEASDIPSALAVARGEISMINEQRPFLRAQWSPGALHQPCKGVSPATS